MSEQHPAQLPPPSNRALPPILAAGLFIAGLVAVWGGLSVLLDRDVVEYPDAGVLLGPIMVLGAAIVVWLVSWRSGGVWYAVVFAIAGVHLVMPAIAAIGYAGIRGDLTWLATAFGHFAISPFIVAAAVLAGLIVALMAALTRRAG